MKPVTKLLLKILWLLLPLAVVYTIFELNLPKVTNSYNKKQRQLDTQLDSIDVLVLGNSHAMKGINPTLISPNAYNLANVSQSLYYDSRLALSYTARMHKLRMVIIPVSYYSLYTELSQTSEHWRDGYYMRFWGIQHPDYKAGIEQHSLTALYTPKESLKYAFKGFNTDLVPEIDAKGFQHTDTTEHHYSANSGEKRVAFHHSIMKEENFAKNIAYLDTLLHTLQQQHISATLVMLPVNKTYSAHIRPKTLETINAALSHMATLYSSPYFCYLESPYFSDADFLDDDHLNMRGAAKMSHILKTTVLSQPVY